MAPQFLRASDGAARSSSLARIIALLTFIFLPFYGGLADLFGVRRITIVGAVGLPACSIAYSLMSGPI